MPASTYLANKLLDHQTGRLAYAMPTAYVGLSSTAPTIGGGNVTEPATGSYTRVATSSATWNPASSGAITNALSITFNRATADWLGGASLTYVVLYDAPVGGNMLSFGAATIAKNILNGDTAKFEANELVITQT